MNSTANLSTNPTYAPTITSTDPTTNPSRSPVLYPVPDPTMQPSYDPMSTPTLDPTKIPTTHPTVDPTTDPTSKPSINPTIQPTVIPSEPTYKIKIFAEIGKNNESNITASNIIAIVHDYIESQNLSDCLLSNNFTTNGRTVNFTIIVCNHAAREKFAKAIDTLINATIYLRRKYPTLSPTLDPTKAPTIRPTTLTSAPTKAHSESVSNTVSNTNQTSHGSNGITAGLNSNANARAQDQISTILLCIGIVLTTCCIMFCTVFGFMRHKKNKKSELESPPNTTLDMAAITTKNDYLSIQSMPSVATYTNGKEIFGINDHAKEDSEGMYAGMSEANTGDKKFTQGKDATKEIDSHHSRRDSEALYDNPVTSPDTTDYITNKSPDDEALILNEDDHMQWSYEQILQWILHLDDGHFVGYKEVLEASLKEENIKGSNLYVVDKADIKGWGIKDFSDKQRLFASIQRLVHQDKEAGATAYL